MKDDFLNQSHSVQLDSYASTGEWNSSANVGSAPTSGLHPSSLPADVSFDGAYSPDLSVLNLIATAPVTQQAPIASKPEDSKQARDETSGLTKKLSVAIPRDLHRLLKKIALDDDITMGQLITDLLSASLRESGHLA